MEDAGMKDRVTLRVNFHGTDELCHCSEKAGSGQENCTPAMARKAVVGTFACLCLSRKGRLTDIC